MEISNKKPGTIRWEIAQSEDGRYAFVGPDQHEAARFLKESVPFHEAAHVVIALRFGLAVDFSTVDAALAKRISNNVKVAAATRREPSKDPHEEAVVEIAGALWDAATLSIPQEVATVQASGDRAKFLQYAPGAEEQARAIRSAKEMLNECRADIIRVGSALKENGTLTGDEIKAILNGGSR
jgi:hypothetical protein